MHPHTRDTLHVVVISRLAPTFDHRAFAAICRGARTRHASLDVGGVLLFDGERFCEWLYGSPAVVKALLATKALDDWHADFRLLHCESGPTHGAKGRWRSGFVAPDALDDLDQEIGENDDAMMMFENLLPTADLEPIWPLGAACEQCAHA